MAIVYVGQKSKYSAKKGIKPFAKPKKPKVYEQGVYEPAKVFRRETNADNVPSRIGNGYWCGSKKVDEVYTGNNVIGIATMHKSNAVPVFTNEQAKETATMRRG